MHRHPRRWRPPAAWLFSLALTSISSLAQPPASNITQPQQMRARIAADPLDARAPVPPAGYISSLAGYRRYGEQETGSWRGANETVNRIGGWRAYAREANEPEGGGAMTPPAAASSAPEAAGGVPRPPAPAGPHGGHSGHGSHKPN